MNRPPIEFSSDDESSDDESSDDESSGMFVYPEDKLCDRCLYRQSVAARLQDLEDRVHDSDVGSEADELDRLQHLVIPPDPDTIRRFMVPDGTCIECRASIPINSDCCDTCSIRPFCPCGRRMDRFPSPENEESDP